MQDGFTMVESYRTRHHKLLILSKGPAARIRAFGSCSMRTQNAQVIKKVSSGFILFSRLCTFAGMELAIMMRRADSGLLGTIGPHEIPATSVDNENQAAQWVLALACGLS